MRKALLRAWLALVPFMPFAAAQASDVPPAPTVQQRVPVSVAGLNLGGHLAVDRIKISMMPGDELGHVSYGAFCANRQPVTVSEKFLKEYGTYEASVATQLLKKYGYPMASLGASNAYSTDVAAAPDYRLGGIVREIKAETCRTGNEAEGWIWLKVDWALYSEKEQKVVFQRTTEGLARSDSKIPDLLHKAVVSTIENFIGAPEFVAAIQPDAATRLAAAPAAPAATPTAAKGGKADEPPVVALRTPIKATDQGLKVRLAVDPVKIAFLPGDELGHSSIGAWCGNTQPVTVTDNFLKNYGRYVGTVVTQALRKNGYPLAVPGDASAFDTEQGAPADFRVGGVLKDLRLEVCHGGNLSEGWVYAKIDWALYSEKERRVVFQQVTEGLSKSKDKVPDLTGKAFVAAIENFLASPEVLAALKAAPAQASAAPAVAEPAAAARTAVAPPAQGGHLQIAGTLPPAGGAQKNQARLRAAVVTLETAHGTGSGFYIDRAGYLLTNFHVVNGAKFVKVKLLNGDKMVAEVVKLSEHDDVALLKSPPVDFDPLAIRPDALDVGEEVYAIGSPLGVLTSTMTRGVLSADRVSQGVHELQSDAAVTFGSSGGPLLDGEGRVIALTKSGYRNEKGFNFFIPVQDALHAVDVSVAR